jgi:carboxymethylenebutenolidase
LNDTIKLYCDRLAREGFVAFAPDLYHGQVAETIPDAEALVTALNANFQQAQAEVADAARFLSERAADSGRRLAVIGFSLGANFALDLSVADPERVRAVVLFYGTGDGDFSKAKAAYMGHFAEHDPYEPKENVTGLEQALKLAGRRVKFYHYSGTGHWFAEADRIQDYRPAAASMAWARTVTFLNRADREPLIKPGG